MFRFLVIAMVSLMAPSSGATPDPARVRASAERSLAFLQKVTAQWKMPCYSCHHQTMPAVALESARAHGLAVDERAAVEVGNRTLGVLASIDDAVQDPMLIDPAMGESFLLWGAQASGIGPSLTTAIYARRLANLQKEDGHWAHFDGRPPSSESLFTSTAVSAAAVAYYMPESLAVERDAALAKARRWLLAAKIDSTEDATFRLLGLRWTGGSASQRRAAAQALLALRREDGGWAQNPRMESDAYSTGEAVAALLQAGLVHPDDPAIAAGIGWLLKNQQPDGTWAVKTRIETKVSVSPPYFESGFPGGHSQFLSCAATSWAMIALAESLPRAEKPAPAIPAATPVGEEPWMRTALFGSAQELAGLLEGGLRVNAATGGGTTLLMMSAQDEAKVRLLLERGADVKARAKSGFDAMLTATLVRGNRAVVKLLLDKGASAKGLDGVKYKMTPLMHVAFTGDAGVAEELLDHGAEPHKYSVLAGTAPNLPLNVATSFEQYDLIRLLVKRGLSIDELDNDKMTNLGWAALSHHNRVVKFLLELGADPHHVDDYGLTPLDHTSGIAGHTSETADLLRPLAKK